MGLLCMERSFSLRSASLASLGTSCNILLNTESSSSAAAFPPSLLGEGSNFHHFLFVCRCVFNVIHVNLSLQIVFDFFIFYYYLFTVLLRQV